VVGRSERRGPRVATPRCSSLESGLGTTTSVGTYPTGASPWGAQDMAGNVWEWTNSLHRPYPYVAADGREHRSSNAQRVLRGAGWSNGWPYARAAYRWHNGPRYTYDFVGVRVVHADLGSA